MNTIPITKRRILFALALLTIIPFSANSQVREIRRFHFNDELTGCGSHLYQWVFGTKRDHLQTCLNKTIAESKKISAVSFHPAGSYFVVGNGKRFEIELWSYKKKHTLLKTYEGHKNLINSFAFSADAHYLLSGSSDRTIKIWDLKKGRRIKNVYNKTVVNTVSISPNGYLFASDFNNDIKIWDFNSTENIKVLKGHKGKINALKFSSDGNYLASGSSDGTVIIWNTKTWEIDKTIKGQGDIIAALDFHKNTKYLAIGTKKGTLSIWNIKKDKLVQVIKNHKNTINDVTFVHDYDKQKSFLLTCGSKYFYTWDIDDLKPAFGIAIKQEIDNIIAQWLKKGENESADEYEKRINEVALKAEYEKVTQEVTTKHALEQHKLENPDKTEYDKINQSYEITFESLEPITVKVPEQETTTFESNFNNLKYLNPIFALNDSDEFYLTYLEVKNPENKKPYRYDALGRAKQFEPDINFVPVNIVKQIGEEEDRLKNNLMDFIQKEVNNKKITENVSTNVNTRTELTTDANGNQIIDYHIEYTYEVIKKTIKNTYDDYPPGKFRLENSNAAKSTMQIIKKTFETELLKYLKPGKKITIKVTGSADASPIRGTIAYDGKYGEFEGEPYYLNGNFDNISISKKEGIKSNEQLAFLRTYGVRQFIENEIEPLRTTENSFTHYVVVAKEKGAQFRRVSIELVIHDAFENMVGN